MADRMADRLSRFIAPLVLGLIVLGTWEGIVRAWNIPPYLLPGPILILKTLITDWSTLMDSWWITMSISLAALTVAVVLGVFLAVLFASSKWIEQSFFPYAVILQVTPIVAIAPLIIIWVNDVKLSLLICAWIVAFFPILSNTTVGLNSADHNLVDLFRLYRAKWWQTLLHLKLPAAMPYFLAGLRISGGLSLIGAVVAEFVAGTGGTSSGLAYQILQAGFQLNIPRLFASLFLITVTGILLFMAMAWLSKLALGGWHESEMAH